MAEADGIMSDKEYVEHEGVRCPVCRNVDLTTLDKGLPEEGWAYVEVKCEKCSSKWREIYNLSGYDFDLEDLEVNHG